MDLPCVLIIKYVVFFMFSMELWCINILYDITRQVEAIVQESGVQSGLVNVYAQGASARIMIQFYLIDIQ